MEFLYLIGGIAGMAWIVTFAAQIAVMAQYDSASSYRGPLSSSEKYYHYMDAMEAAKVFRNWAFRIAAGFTILLIVLAGVIYLPPVL